MHFVELLFLTPLTWRMAGRMMYVGGEAVYSTSITARQMPVVMHL
jgi:hypothetical protein